MQRWGEGRWGEGRWGESGVPRGRITAQAVLSGTARAARRGSGTITAQAVLSGSGEGVVVLPTPATSAIRTAIGVRIS